MDSQLVVLDPQGRSDFETLRRRLALRRPTSVEYAAKRTPAAIFAFDLLELRGKDVRALPLLKRKAMLKDGLRGPDRVRYLNHVAESGHRLFQVAEELGLEGMVAKRGGAPYHRGRASCWIKVKTSTGRLIDEQRASGTIEPDNSCGDGPRHWMILSACSSTAAGTVRPSRFAVCTLTTSSNLVGCSIGRLAGLAPFKILST